MVRVPEASFRGPDTDRNLRAVPKEERQKFEGQLRGRVREQNRTQARPSRTRPTVDTVGNRIPPEAPVILRDHVSRLSVGYKRIHRDFGDPSHSYFFVPRSHDDYWDGYWDGYADGYWNGKHRHHRAPVVVSFYYGYYWSDPLWFAFYYPGYYPAVYHYWGWSPGWVYPQRVYYSPTTYVYAPRTAYRYYGTDRAVDEMGARRALEDVRKSWLDGDISTLAYHLNNDLDIQVYFDGEYEYSTTTDDYYAMTVDAMATTYTVDMDFDRIIWLSSREFFVTGRHVFYDPDDVQQTVFISYRMRNLGGEWNIVSVGSSLEPIRHQYEDFRF